MRRRSTPRWTATRSSPSSTRTSGAASSRALLCSRTITASPSAHMSALPEPLYCLDAARSEEQRRYMEELAAAGICIFCPEHVASQQREPIEHSGRHWYVKKNDYP